MTPLKENWIKGMYLDSVLAEGFSKFICFTELCGLE